jgi:hypothetical protein
VCPCLSDQPQQHARRKHNTFIGLEDPVIKGVFQEFGQEFVSTTVPLTAISFCYFSTLLLQSLPLVNVHLVKNEFYEELNGLIEGRQVYRLRLAMKCLLIPLSNAGGTLLCVIGKSHAQA